MLSVAHRTGPIFLAGLIAAGGLIIVLTRLEPSESENVNCAVARLLASDDYYQASGRLNFHQQLEVNPD